MRRRTLPPVDELLAALAEAGVADAPAEGPDATMLQGLLDMALYVAEHKKSISFDGFTWADPAFVATDAKVTLRFAYGELVGDVAMTLAANLPRLAGERTLLALDARRAGAREFTLGHALYGEPTLFQFPSRPVEPADPRIDAAREAGWTPTLKAHNLLPGRGIVVLDEHQGLLLRDERFADVFGFLVLFDTGQTELWWNPFARGADAELQHWRAWGPGTGPASGWRERFYAEPGE
ncbi:MAG TPA: hypothetical protein VM582_04240 [Candidatus Thermoplasmatota archaeon]|nr:hypothetical protein [Candidatus Thermoplasmatota archaeon]